MLLVICLAAVTAVLRGLDRLYYRDNDRVLRLLRLAPAAHGSPKGYYRPLDRVFAWFPFVWVWCDILLTLALCRAAAAPGAWILGAVIVGGRLRALQEVSHTALHSGLCRSRRYQWAIANVAVQWPLFRPDMHHRYIGHVAQHHRHANEPELDPNITRFVRFGITPGLTRAQWRRKLWHPLTPTGFADTVKNVWAATTRQNERVWMLPVRLAVAASTLTGVLLVAGQVGLAVGFVLPLLTVYPFFSWLSVLAEHRWFARCQATDRRERECVNGRPTDHPGLLGWAVKHLVFPFSDHYHLAHSLYPLLRWNYLPAVDRALKARDPHYPRYRSVGLLATAGGVPSALSELRERLSTPDHPDVAEWARDLPVRAGRPAAVSA